MRLSWRGIGDPGRWLRSRPGTRRLRVVHFHFRPRYNVGDEAVVLAVRQLVETAIGPVRWTSRRLRVLQQPIAVRQQRHINAHDLVIVGGGGLYSRWGLPLDTRAVAGIGLPLVVYGAGLNRNLDDGPLEPAQLDSIHRLHERAALASVRDEASRTLLASLGHEAQCTGDPALFLTPRPQRQCDGTGRPLIGINFAAHGWQGQERLLDTVLDRCVPVLRELAARQDAGLCYLVHARAELPLLPRLRAALPGLRIVHLPAPQLAHAYQQMSLVVSMMLHSSILAWAAGVPFVNIGYDDKNRAFMADIGRLAYHLPVDGMTDGHLRAAVDAALADHEAVVSGRQLLQTLAGRTTAFGRAIAAVVNR